MTELGSNTTDLWSFALGVYLQEGIAAQFLAFQEEFGADVNLLLYSCWEGAGRGRRLSGDEIGTAASHVADWHAEVVRPLRALRTRLKPGFPPIEAIGSDRLREQIKALEIGAERLELGALEAAALHRPPDAAPDVSLAAENLRASLLYYAGRDLPPEAEARVCRVAEAVAKAT